MESIFVFDLGFSSAKWMHQEKRGRVWSVYKTSGDEVLLGEAAVTTTSASYLANTDALVRRYAMFASGTAKSNSIPIQGTIVVGLPYTYWERESQSAGRGAIAQLEASLKDAGWKKVLVLPQGLGGVRAFFEEVGGADKGAGTLGIDIGFNTVIYSLYSPVQQKIILGKTLDKRGIYQMVTDHLVKRPDINDLIRGKSLTPVDVSIMMEERRIQSGFSRHDISREVAACAQEYVQHLVEDLVDELTGNTGAGAVFDRVAVFGGGARLLSSDSFPAFHGVDVHILDEPEYANARGFAMIGGAVGEDNH